MSLSVAESGRRLRIHRCLDRRDVRAARILQELQQGSPHLRLPASLEVVEAEDEAACVDQRGRVRLGDRIRVGTRLDLVVRGCEAAEMRPDGAPLGTGPVFY